MTASLRSGASPVAFEHQCTHEPLSRWVTIFLGLGMCYPLLRVELMEYTGIPSPVLGAWVDLLTFGLLLLLSRHKSNQSLTRNPVALAVLLILAAGSLSVFLGSDPFTIAYGLRQTYLPVIFFFVGLHLGRSWVSIEKLWLTLIIVLSLSAVTGIVLTLVVPEYWTSLFLRDSANSREWGLLSIARESGLRMTGAILDPVVFGTISAWGVAFSLNALLVSRRSSRAFMLGLALLACLVGVVLSLSRGAWFGAALATVVSFAMNPRWLVSKKFIAFALCLASLFVVLADGEDTKVLMNILSRTVDKTLSEGNDQRDGQFDGVIDNLPSHPLGNGLGDAGHVGERFSVGGLTDDGYPHITDGWYLKLLAEGGIPLFITFALYLAVSFILLLKSTLAARGIRPRAFLSALLGIQLATLAQAMVSNVWDLYYLSQLLWLMGGVAAAFHRVKPRRRRAPSPAINHASQVLGST